MLVRADIPGTVLWFEGGAFPKGVIGNSLLWSPGCSWVSWENKGHSLEQGTPGVAFRSRSLPPPVVTELRQRPWELAPHLSTHPHMPTRTHRASPAASKEEVLATEGCQCSQGLQTSEQRGGDPELGR